MSHPSVGSGKWIGVVLVMGVMGVVGLSACRRDLGTERSGVVDEAPAALGLSLEGVDIDLPGTPDVRLRWIGASAGGEGETSTEGNSGRGRWRVGSATVTEDVFAAKGGVLWVIHARSDMPGSLEFRVELGDEAEVEGRRLLREGESRAWVFPMESDVSTVDGGIEVRGEGEALVVAGSGEAAVAAMRELGVEEDRVEDVRELWQRLDALKEVP